MPRAGLHPTRFGFAVGLAIIALWAALWIWFLAALALPRIDTQKPGIPPRLARAHFEEEGPWPPASPTAGRLRALAAGQEPLANTPTSS